MVNAAAGNEPAGLADLTSGRVLARNALLNLVGNAAPMVVALFTIPVLTRALGADRFGIITLSWVLVGYFGLFDLGLGRAITQTVADRLGRRLLDEIPGLFWTALAILGALSVSATLLLAACTPVVVTRIIHVDPALHVEAMQAFWILALTIPFVVVTTATRGLLEAYQRFDYITYLRVPLGVFIYLGPVLVLPFTHSVVATVAVIFVARVIACAGSLALCFRVQPALRQQVRLVRLHVPMLLRFGGWMTVSNVVSPLMVSMDRFYIAAVLSVGAVAYYAAPYEVVTKLLIVPGAIAGVLFPAFSTSLSREGDARTIYEQSLRAIVIVIAPIVLLLAVFAREGLRLWLGADFAEQGTPVVQWLALGVLFNGLAQVPFALVQAAGRPEVTAKLHLLELPVYAGFLVALTARFGLAGAAMAWAGRVLVDLVLLLWASVRVLRQPLGVSWRALWTAPLAAAGLALVLVNPGLGCKLGCSVAWLAAFFALGWLVLLDHGERSRVVARLRCLREARRD